MPTPGWYLRRLSRMGPAEIVGRASDAVRKRRWRRRLDAPLRETWVPRREFAVLLPKDAVQRIVPEASATLVGTADRIMDGYATYFGRTRDDLVSPDWSRDPKTGRHAPTEVYAFDIPYRDESAVGDIKQIWEPSRHQHLTVLAAAYAFTGDESYAHRVADHLKSWWTANPPLRGVHWVSGIELGIRLLSWVWVRRLLDGWPGVRGLFEENPEALHQIHEHQRWLAAFPSRGSSANNHAVAEAAGLLSAACAFPWFGESARWRSDALRDLDRHLVANTFDSGLNRELASEYHGLVLELGLAAAVEAEAAGVTVPDSTWQVLVRMADALAAVVDTRLRAPRQGDSDDGYGLVVDGADVNRWASLLATSEVLFGRMPWWPAVSESDARTPLLTSLIGSRGRTATRPARRPGHFTDAGMTVLRSVARDGGEVWCRCDGGPHGFLSIAAHAHADALSLEVRHNGVDVLADPGTYCYHGEPAWRSYFRSTLGHNTLRLDDTDQSTSGGPFLWTRHAYSRVLVAEDRRWSAEHDGYAPAVHRRTVDLDGAVLRVRDEIRSPRRHPCVLAFHLGPAISVAIGGSTARLRWADAARPRLAVLRLPPQLAWTVHRGETDPPLGWYSPGFGVRQPAVTLLGRGVLGSEVLSTTLEFTDGREFP